MRDIFILILVLTLLNSCGSGADQNTNAKTDSVVVEDPELMASDSDFVKLMVKEGADEAQIKREMLRSDAEQRKILDSLIKAEKNSK